MNPFETPTPSEQQWYDLAKSRIDRFLPTLDPALRVEVIPLQVTTSDSERNYHTLALRFVCATKPARNWTMDIEPSEHYIAQELEAVVRRIYLERSKEIT